MHHLNIIITILHKRWFLNFNSSSTVSYCYVIIFTTYQSDNISFYFRDVYI